MIKDSLSYNPHFVFKDSVSGFRLFLKQQDEVPAGINGIQDDHQIRIVQAKVQKPKSIEKSLFSAHELHPSVNGIKEKEVMTYGWVAPVLIFSFTLLAFAQYSWPKRILQIIKAFFTGRLFVQLAREGGLFNERVTMVLFSSYLISISLFIFQLVNYYNSGIIKSMESIVFYGELLFAVLAFYVVKMGLYRFSGFLFKSSKEIADYNMTIFVFGQIAGIMMLPFLVIITYIQSNALIIGASVIFGLLYLYRLYRGVVTVTSVSKISPYYLFLYLCTLEILPLVLLIKIIWS